MNSGLTIGQQKAVCKSRPGSLYIACIVTVSG